MKKQFLALPLEAKLLTLGAAEGRVKMHGIYHTTDPYFVRLVFEPFGSGSWRFPRNLIADALVRYADVSEGQIKILPYGMDHFAIVATQPAGTVVLRFEEPVLAGFLGDTEDLVPRGQESAWLTA